MPPAMARGTVRPGKVKPPHPHASITVARGPVPRDLSARDTPGEGQALALRAATLTVARGPVPRDFPMDRSMARDRPSPYGEGAAFFHRSAGTHPPRFSGRPQHGEGQALALR